VFESVGWGEILVLVVAGLFILGPERLPGAAAWVGQAVRQVRNYATGAREQLRGEFGSDLDQLRKPLDDLRSLRELDPRRAMRRTLFDEPAPPSNGSGIGNSTVGNGSAGNGSSGNGSSGVKPVSAADTPLDLPSRPLRRPVERLARNERPPIDPDAT
jgi:sec-independent protein translocase protein TatB